MEGEKKQKRIIVLFYSSWGHIETLAKEIVEGINTISGVKAELWRVPETLSDDVLAKMYIPKKSDEIPVLSYDKLDELEKADGILFGFPTRFGMMCAQMKSLMDATGGLWSKGT